MALSFELLRTLNTARVQGTQIAGNGPVLTLRRVVALIGVDGVRKAANSLRAWPGPLDDAGARALLATIDRVRLAGHVAQALRPAGYDAEAVYLVAVLQNLGRLLLRYHFAEEAEQIQQLMQPGPRPSTATACRAAGPRRGGGELRRTRRRHRDLGNAVARQWGLGEEILHMIRRMPGDAPVRKPDSDAELLRIVASAANEAVDVAQPRAGAEVPAALNNVVERYARVLRLNTRALDDALHDAKDGAAKGGMPTSAGRREADGDAESRLPRKRAPRPRRAEPGDRATVGRKDLAHADRPTS